MRAQLEEPAEAAIVAQLRAGGCVFAEQEARLLLEAASTPAELATMLERRAQDGLPLEQVLGWAEFCGLRIALESGVFVPRRRTELLVHQARALAPPAAIVVELCCGSGAIGAALLAGADLAELHATDLDPAAIACARRNLAGDRTHVYEGDLYEPLPRSLAGRVEILLANAPYVPTAEIGLLPREARLHEPLRALDGGEDGLVIQRRLIEAAPGWLAPRGSLLVETSQAQGPAALEACGRGGLTARLVRSEELDATVLVATIGGGSAATA